MSAVIQRGERVTRSALLMTLGEMMVCDVARCGWSRLAQSGVAAESK